MFRPWTARRSLSVSFNALATSFCVRKRVLRRLTATPSTTPVASIFNTPSVDRVLACAAGAVTVSSGSGRRVIILGLVSRGTGGAGLTPIGSCITGRGVMGVTTASRTSSFLIGTSWRHDSAIWGLVGVGWRSRQDMTGTGASSALVLLMRSAGIDWGTSTGLMDLGGEDERMSFDGVSGVVGVTGANAVCVGNGVGGEAARARVEAMMLAGRRERGLTSSTLLPLTMLSGWTEQVRVQGPRPR